MTDWRDTVKTQQELYDEVAELKSRLEEAEKELAFWREDCIETKSGRGYVPAVESCAHDWVEGAAFGGASYCRKCDAVKAGETCPSGNPHTWVCDFCGQAQGVVERRGCFSCVSPEACKKDGCRFFEGPMIAPGSE